MKFRNFLAAAILFALMININLSAQENVVLDAAKKELKRTMNELASDTLPPYFIAYGITDEHTYQVTAGFGNVRSEQSSHERTLDIDLRVGDYRFDNTHIIRGNPFNFSMVRRSAKLPVENDEQAIRNMIWSTTDEVYKAAVEKYEKALTNQAVKVEEEDTSADLSREKPHKYIGSTAGFHPEEKKWKDFVRGLSAEFQKYQWLFEGDVIFMYKTVTKYLVNSEGTELRWPETFARIYVTAKTKADDGMSLPLYKSYFAFDPDGLPTAAVIKEDIRETVDLLDRLRKAPLLKKTYSGPAILSGRAAGVFFHEIFGHRIEGHREKNPNSGQTFKHSVDEEVLPDFIDVYMDPTKKELAGVDLSGYYPFDDEGIPSQRVVVVENGVFKNFLMSRSPIEDFPISNGHGRREPGYPAVTRQSNLIVHSDKTVPADELREMLREECRKQDKEYGLYFDQIQGGFTFTGRAIPNSFKVNPLVVYKVYADGRPDELIRGVDLIGTPLATFSKIKAAADDVGTFNGICGAESGGVPVSANAPSLLVTTIEVQRKQKSQAKPPLLPSPVKTAEN